MKWIFRIGVLCSTPLYAACTSIPDADVRWLEDNKFIGQSVAVVEEQLVARGFSKSDKPWVHDPADSPYAVNQTAKIGFRDVVGDYSGEISCFLKGYSRISASGDRIICFASQDTKTVSWIQASFFGAHL